ncbi:hypothetical protein ACFQEQ_11220 [Halolamina salina]|uniref:hypothetical protein n=1 Tax=Halolamina salina TaxID=1220023 RepID=UPI003615E88A
MALIDIFVSAILPIVLIAGVGFTLGRAKDVEPGPLNTATVYVLAPALVLHSLLDTGLGGETLVRLAAAVTAFTLGMAALVELSGRLLGVDDREYELESEDVVSLPADNAEALLQREAAERLW